MSEVTLKIRLKSNGPALMNSPVLSDPLHPKAKLLKLLNKNKSKTDENYLEIAKIQFTHGVYYDTAFGGVHWPCKNIRASLIDGAKVHKNGKKVKEAVVFLEYAVPLKYKGPRTPDELFEDPKHLFKSSIPTGRGTRVNSYRAMFPEWECEFSLIYDNELITEEEIMTAFDIAGRRKCLGDYRPLFGKYFVEKLK